MANPHAGEVEVTVDGQPRTARLTLGALAELEARLDGDTLLALVGRFEAGDISSRDVMALLVAGLRGGGWPVTEADLLTAEIAGGPLGAVRVAAELLARAFQVPGAAPPAPRPRQVPA